MAMDPATLLEAFDQAAAAVARAVKPVVGADRRARTERRGQYAIDLVADEAALAVLSPLGLPILSEESGWTGPSGPLSIVLDPIDGSTNCSRGIPYWSISLCAVDGDGPLAALVVNQATGLRFAAARGEGATCDGAPIVPAKTEQVGAALVALSGTPAHWLGWKQFRSLGSVALTLCDVASGAVDGLVDGYASHAPWDYLGGLLICQEAGAVVADAQGRSLTEVGDDVRRQLLAAGTPALLDELRQALQ
jgi:myo-inositol-1(or 4)-monophosphatase